MSHAATDWAIKQRGLKPATKIVLWHLCDRYHPDHGCFPSQETLADDCEMSRSSLNSHLTILEDKRLIARENQRHPENRRHERTRYRFAFEPGFPCPESGHGSVSRKGSIPCPDLGDSRVQNLDSNLVREPVSEPVRESAHEKDGSLELFEAAPAKRRRKQVIDPEWTVGEREIAYAAQKGFERAAAERMFEHFAAHHGAKGTMFLDWNKAWQTWVLNQQRFGEQHKAPPPARPALPRMSIDAARARYDQLPPGDEKDEIRRLYF